MFSVNLENLLKLFFLLLFVFIILVIMPFSAESQAILSFFLLSVSIFLSTYKNLNIDKDYIKLFIIFSFIFISLRYFYWRIAYTLNFDNIFNAIGSLLLVLAEIYAFLIAFVGFFVTLKPIEREAVDIDKFSKDELPTVDILIPTYNEPVEIIKTTLLAASAMDYPKDKFKIYLLDDGGTTQKINDKDPKKRQEALERRRSLQKLVKEISDNIYYLTREKNEHAKAGNINEALKKTNGDLILILDCDHVPSQDFLRNTVGFFLENPKLFLVQTPHKFINADPIEKNLRIFRQVPSENEMFYDYIQKGLDFWNSSFFCGSAALLRRKYLDEVGGVVGDTITEDAETALTLHARGYDSVYYPKGMILGLQPETFSSFITQRSRWASGMIQIFLMKNPLKFKKLKWYQKLAYLNSNLFWFFPIARVIFIISPMFFILLNLQVYDANLNEVIAYTLFYYLFSLFISYYLYGKYRWPFFSEIYETAQSLFILPTIISTIKNPKKPTFKVTPKGENIAEDFISPFYKPVFFLFHLVLLAMIVAIIRYIYFPNERGTIIVLFAWLFFDWLLLSMAIIITYERAEHRKAYRRPTFDDAIVYIDNKPIAGKVKDVSLGGIWIQTDVDLSDKVDKLKNSVLKFYIKDERGMLFLVKGKVVIVDNHNIKMTFIIDSLESERKIVEIVYSQKSAWEEVVDIKENDPFHTLLFLLKVTFKDFILAYKNEVRQFVLDSKDYFKNIIRSVNASVQKIRRRIGKN